MAEKLKLETDGPAFVGVVRSVRLAKSQGYADEIAIDLADPDGVEVTAYLSMSKFEKLVEIGIIAELSRGSGTLILADQAPALSLRKRTKKTDKSSGAGSTFIDLEAADGIPGDTASGKSDRKKLTRSEIALALKIADAEIKKFRPNVDPSIEAIAALAGGILGGRNG